MRFRPTAADHGTRLDHFLHAQMPEYSRSRIQSWIREDRVLVDGSPQKTSFVVRGGESIDVEPAAPPPLKAEPEDAPIHILYEDDAVIAIDKPAGLVVHAGAGHLSGTLVNRLVHHFQSLSSTGGDMRPGIVHRLDRDTSGVLLVARTDSAHQQLAEQFASRSVEKLYLALVHGSPKQERGHIESKIARDPVHRTRMTARLATGRSAITDWEVLRRIGKLALLQVKIGTGRTHQIRVHLASIGHAVVGDSLYGAPKLVEGTPPLGRFFLHAHRISFDSPATGARVTVESPLAPELAEWLESYNREKQSP